MHSRVLMVSIILVSAAISASQGFGETTLVSQSPLGAPANNQCRAVAVSGNGRFVAFCSFATNLVPSDTNGDFDVFVRDRLLGITTLVSVSSTGEQGNGPSGLEGSNPYWKTVSISFDGSIVAFESDATNLVAGDTNNRKDIFVRNLKFGTTERVSISTQGIQTNVGCQRPSLSADGTVVAFSTEASNLVPGDTNSARDIFVRDMIAGTTTRVSVSSTGAQSNAYSDFPDVSGDGRFVAFNSYANNLVVGDTNGYIDIFVRDRLSEVTERCSVSNTGAQANGSNLEPSISDNGDVVSFTTIATNLVEPDTNGTTWDVVVHHRKLGTVERVSDSSYGVQGNASSYGSKISADGRWVAFESTATNLVPNHTATSRTVYRHDRLTAVTQKVSVSSAGVSNIGPCFGPTISPDGRVIAFLGLTSTLTNHGHISSVQVFANDRSRLIELAQLTIVRGVVSTGGLPSIATSDDDRLTLLPGLVFSTSQQPVLLIVDAVSPTNTLSELTIGIESSGSSMNIVQATEMYNFASGMYELVDSRPVSTTDNLALITITQDPTRFIGPNGELRARIGYKAAGPVFSYPWQARLDVVFWEFEP